MDNPNVGATTAPNAAANADGHNIKQRVERLALDQIKPLPWAQHPSEQRVKWLVDNFDAPKLGKPIVSLRGGVYYLVDGYHRVAALRKLAAQHAVFWVVEGFTPDDETRLMSERKYGNKKSNKSGGTSMLASNSAAMTANCAALNAVANEAVTTPAHKAPLQKYALIDLDQVRGTSFQRNTDNVQIDKILADFDEARLDPLLVAVIGGQYHLIDGLHRSTALRRMGYTQAYARVLEGLSYEQAAGIFRRQNIGKRPISTFDEFKAGVEEKDAECLEINRIVGQNGFTVGRSGGNFSKIESVRAIVFIVRNFGYKVLDDTLCLLASTWSGMAKASQKECLLGVAEFVNRYGMVDFSERLKEKFGAVIYEYSEVTKYRGFNGERMLRLKFCRTLVNQYNKGLGSNNRKRLIWEDDEV